jgi:hypothetical protein
VTKVPHVLQQNTFIRWAPDSRALCQSMIFWHLGQSGSEIVVDRFMLSTSLVNREYRTLGHPLYRLPVTEAQICFGDETGYPCEKRKS